MSPLLELKAISKRYPGVQALDSVDFTSRAGEIHTLMGENGAGKSTLIKVLTGAERADGGEIWLRGELVSPRNPAEAQAAGISTVYQEVNLIPTLSVAENLALGRQPQRGWRGIDWRALNVGAERALARLDLRIDVTRSLASYSIAVQQMVAIARALDLSAKVLVLDEPTSSLDADEVGSLFRIMRGLRDQGLAIVFVTHFLDQVYAVSDRITVLRNGRLVGEYIPAELPREALIGKMMGREFTATARAASVVSEGALQPGFLEARGLGRRGVVNPVDLDIAPGEVVGLAGLLGSGRSEVARMLFGIEPADTGHVIAGGKAVRIHSPRDAIRTGFGLVPEDRKAQSIIPHLSIRENIVLALQARSGWLRYWPRKRRQALAERFIRALNIACASADQPIGTLSGGNQQKVILARWLASEPRLLMLDEPTRGIDVGAKAEIKKLVRDFAASGKALLFISSELEEMVECCSRVSVMRDRSKVGELRGAEITEHAIVDAIARTSTGAGDSP